MIDRDALEFLQKNLESAVEPGEHSGVRYVRDGFKPVEVAANPVSLNAHSLSSLALILAKPHGWISSVDLFTRVLVGKTGVVAMLESRLSGGDARVRINLEKHPAWVQLEKLASTHAMDQKQLVRMLRATFDGMVDPSVIALFRNLRVETSGKAAHVMDPAIESLDRSVRAKLESAGGKLPDHFVLSVPVFTLPELIGFTVPVIVLVESVPGETDGGGPRFELTTVYSTLELGVRKTMDQLIMLVEQELEDAGLTNIPVLHASI